MTTAHGANPMRAALRRNESSRSRVPLMGKPIRSHTSRGSFYHTFNSKKLKLKLDSSHNEKPGKLVSLARLLLPIEAMLFFSFWLFGTLVSMQYGVVVTAASDLVGTSAPPGLILFAYTLPSIMVRVFVPYIKFPDVSNMFNFLTSPRASDYSSVLTPGGLRTPGTPGMVPKRNVSHEVNYATRLSICAASSLVGLQLLAWSDRVAVRMLGIMMASLSSNLGDMSFFQLATRYPAMIARSFGGYAAGSGAAGLLGSFTYAFFTSTLHISPSTVLSGIGLAPTIMLLTYFFVLPTPEEAERATSATADDPAAEGFLVNKIEGEGEGDEEHDDLIGSLKLGDKLRLVKPMVWGYMIPLATLMFLENVTTQGILPTILWNLPFSRGFISQADLFNTFFKSTRDFYPFFYTVYQLAVFFGRTSITLFRLPGGNRRSSAAYWILCAVEVGCFLTQLTQSLSMAAPIISQATKAIVDPDGSVRFSPLVVMIAMFTMGLCGGLGMSNTYWRVSKKPLPPAVWQALDQARVKSLRGRTDITQEDGTMAPGAHDDGYFQRRPRLRKSNTGRELTLGGHAILLQPRTPEAAVVLPSSADHVPQQRSQADETAVREFLISTIAMPDTVAILVASIVSLWLQPTLCRWQMEGGRSICGAS